MIGGGGGGGGGCAFLLMVVVVVRERRSSIDGFFVIWFKFMRVEFDEIWTYLQVFFNTVRGSDLDGMVSAGAAYKKAGSRWLSWSH